MKWFLYNILLVPVFLLMLPVFVWKMLRRGGYSRGFPERFCIVDPDKLSRIGSGGMIWVHAVSVGELQIALAFIEAFRVKHPGSRFLVSVNTSTAYKICFDRKNQADVLVYMPLDFPWITEKAMRLYHPAALVLTETEIWPNLIRYAKKAGVPVCIINGRLAERTKRFYSRLAVFFRPVTGMIDGVFMQTKQDADRIISVGAESARTCVLGNAKYDIALATVKPLPDPESFKSSLGLSGTTLLLGGSTWAGEEEALLEVYKDIVSEFPELRLVLVPRHMERRNEIISAIREAGLDCIKRSDNRDGRREVVSEKEVWLIDTTGELVRFYGIADVVFIGRTLFSHGGQNMIEPACLGKPVLAGPNVQNFMEVSGLLKSAGGLIEVSDVPQLKVEVRQLLSDRSKRADAGMKARKAVESMSGALDRYVAAVAGLVSKKMP